ncbi:hypothetical protein A0H81_03262 [Grifola frondosa]|uniref:Fungal-type protein kinase domain-containing protein n=1 Tax=Grifola frondosa TaxID=5627 RepID=A0A1C7MIG6_GRIFR|nr:hypothetical protein A0H81_03262 [Grifola frondosa]
MSNPDPKFSTEPRPGSPVRRVLPYLEPSSPVKATTNPGNIRIPGHVKNASARLPDIDVSDFMNLLSPEYDIKTIPESVQSLLTRLLELPKSTKEETLYQPICDLLNACAAHVEEHMKVRGLNHAPLLFVIHADSAPSEHALGTKVRPDLVAVNASAEEIEYYRRTKNIAQQDEQKDGPEEQRKKSKQFVGVPWARLCMTIEVKPMVVKDGGREQAAMYTTYHLIGRPDCVGVFGLCLSPSSFRLYWSDAEGTRITTPMELINGGHLLMQLMWTVRRPAARTLIMIVLSGSCQNSPKVPATPIVHDVLDCHQVSPVKYGSLLDCRYGSLLLVKKSMMTCGWFLWEVRLAAGGSTFSVDYKHNLACKDIFLSRTRFYFEHRMLNIAHDYGRSVLPGVPILVEYAVVKDREERFITTCESQWKRLRIVVEGIGETLESCPTIYELLKVLYDLVETHRLLCARGVLHRDISMGNVLWNVHKPPLRKTYQSHEGGVYISRVLDKTQVEDPNKCLCLLADFDNSAFTQGSAKYLDNLKANSVELDPSIEPEEPGNRSSRTGTPMFIARAVSSGRLLQGPGTLPPDLPKVSDKAASLYKAAYKDINVEYPKPTLVPPGPETPPFCHREYHDMESVFWLLVYRLIMWGDGKDELEYDGVHPYLRDFLSHEISSMCHDQRGAWIDQAEFPNLLHSRLRKGPIATLITEMFGIVWPEYALCEGVSVDFVHEAFRRLLINAIVEMDATGEHYAFGEPRGFLKNYSDPVAPQLPHISPPSLVTSVPVMIHVTAVGREEALVVGELCRWYSHEVRNPGGFLFVYFVGTMSRLYTVFNCMYL